MGRFLEPQRAGGCGEAFAGHANPEFSRTAGTGDNPELTAIIPWAGRRLPDAESRTPLTGRLCAEAGPPRAKRVATTRLDARAAVGGSFRAAGRSAGA